MHRFAGLPQSFSVLLDIAPEPATFWLRSRQFSAVINAASREPMSTPSRNFFRSILLAASIAVAGAPILGNSAQAQGDRGAMPGDFDYYVLALSWSPTYCNGRGGSGGDGERGNYDRRSDEDSYRDNDRNDDRRGYSRRRGDGEEQCTGTRPYSFVLHGLWPQYERKGWPEMCRTNERPWVPEETIDRMMDIMPSRRLVIQEYKKHGTCTGLDPRQYFDTARKAFSGIRIPEEFRDLSQPLSVTPESIQKAFLAANPQLRPDMIQVVCSRQLLRELRICFSKDLTPRSCSQNEQNRRLCTYDTVTLPPVRGGGTGPRGGPSYGRDGGRL
jgi:ribonuclease T2